MITSTLTGRVMCVCRWVGVVLSLSLLGCQVREVQPTFKDDCGILRSNVNWSNRIKVLNLLSLSFSQKCDPAVIEYREQPQSDFRDKAFSFSREMAGVFLSDGVLTEYVLESYERAYLSVLLAASYRRTGHVEDAKVELRRLDHELFTPLYNFGEDPVNLVLSAVLWEVLGEPGDARTDWFRLAEPTSSFLLHVAPLLQAYPRAGDTAGSGWSSYHPVGGLWGLSILGGTQLMQIAPTVFQVTVRPDLRHWELLLQRLL